MAISPTSNPQVYIYESEYRMIHAAMGEFTHDETGGDLYGSFTHGDMPVIWLASGPGPRVRRNRVHFEQDTNFTTEWERYLMETFGIQYIGSWHSHHSLGLNQPSSGDREAARTYAVNHHRRRTLEIIVTYERNREITLWFYFYPDAARGGLLRANSVLLPEVSPVRLRLKPESERTFSGSTDWRRGKLPGKAIYQSSQSDFGFSNRQNTQYDQNTQDIQNMAESHQEVEIPEFLNEELESVNAYLENITFAKKMFVVELKSVENTIVAFSIDPQATTVRRIELIDRRTNKSKDITEYIQKRYPLKIRRNSNILLSLLLAVPSVQEQLAFYDERQSQARIQQSGHEQAVPEERRARSTGSLAADAVPMTAWEEQQQLNQQGAPSDAEAVMAHSAHANMQSSDVRVYCTKSITNGYEIRITTQEETTSDQIQDILHQFEMEIQQMEVELQANNELMTKFKIRSVTHLDKVMITLKQKWQNLTFTCDKSTGNDLQKLFSKRNEN